MSVCEIAIPMKRCSTMFYRFSKYALSLCPWPWFIKDTLLSILLYTVYRSSRSTSYTYTRLRFYVSLHSSSLSLSFILAVSLDHVHTLRALIPKVFSSSLLPSLFFVHFTLPADSRAFSLVRRFPTKSESPYLARKKKFYHSVSTCSSTSFSPSHSVVCRLSEHCRRIIVFLSSIMLLIH